MKQSSSPAVLQRLTQKIAERRSLSAQRRQHDDAISDPRVNSEHQAAISHAHAQGRPGCQFCG